MKIIRVVFCFTTLMMLSAVGQAATSHALLVGVTNYPTLPEGSQLYGPKNDIESARDFLANQQMRSFPRENITILADGVKNAGVPTHAAIVAAMDHLVKQAEEGDFIYMHFAGHGSRQPAKASDIDETDGLDEIFLPVDIGKWEDDTSAVENALVDNEIGEKITAMRKKGAFVWAVFDSCHSGTVTRGAPIGNDVKMRKVSEGALGIPQAALDSAVANVPKMRGHSNLREAALDGGSAKAIGGFVAFYAAQTTQQTPEMRLPKDDPNRKAHGMFTFTMLQVLSEYPGISYRQAGQEILQRYAAANMDRPTPLFEGDLDARIFGSEASARTQQWPVEVINDEWHIPAGSMSRLANGSVVALLSSPTDSDDKALGYAELSNVQGFDSVVKPVAYKGQKADSLKMLPKLAYARLVERKLDFSVRVARPEPSKEAMFSRIKRVLDNFKADEDSGLRVSWVGAGEDADVRLAVKGGHLYFLSPIAVLVEEGNGKTPSIDLKGKGKVALTEAVSDNLASIARVLNLLRASQGMSIGSNNVEVQLTVKRKSNGERVDISAGIVPDMYPDDTVYITMTNSSSKIMDLNVLFIGSDYSISHLNSYRINPRGSLKNKGLLRITGDSFGAERLLVIANEAKPQTEVMDLSFLAQKSLPKTRGSRNETGLVGLLKDAGFGRVKTRGAARFVEEDEGGSASMLLFQMETKRAP